MSDFTIKGRVELLKDAGGDYVQLRYEDVACNIYLHGAHVSSFVKDGVERLWMSKTAVFDGKKAIRGGIPICWPQFGPGDGKTLPQHGFARNCRFEILNTTATAKETSASFDLSAESAASAVALLDGFDGAARWIEAHPFRLIYTVRIGSESPHLRLELRTQSLAEKVGGGGGDGNGDGDDGALLFTMALHTYFRIPPSIKLEQLHVIGLIGLEYIDKTDGMKRKREEKDALMIAGEVDRVYDGGGARGLIRLAPSIASVLADAALPDVVVWNPGPIVAKNMSDFDDDGYLSMICVENGAIVQEAKATRRQEHAAHAMITFEDKTSNE